MKTDFDKELKGQTLLSRVVLQGLSQAAIEALTAPDRKGDKLSYDIKLTVDGHEVDVSKFMNHWQKYVDEIVADEAKKLLGERIGEVQDLLSDLKGRLEGEIDKRKEDWEK